jgi:tetratricopeptide (TPR) repeat protein
MSVVWISRCLIATLAPFCLFPGAVVNVAVRPASAQENLVNPQDLEALLAEGDRLFDAGDFILQSCESPLPLVSIQDVCPNYKTDYQQALGYFQQVLQLYQSSDGGFHENEIYYQYSLKILNRIGDTHYELGNHFTALDWYKQALEIAQASQNAADEAEEHLYIGDVYRELRQFDDSLAAHHQAIEIWRQAKDFPGIAKTYKQIGILYYSFGLGIEALDYFQQALDIYKQIGDSGEEANIWIYIGWTLNPMGHEDQALAAFSHSLEIAEELDDRHRQGQLKNFMGSTYRFLGQYEKSLESYQESLYLLRQEKSLLALALEASTLLNMALLYQRLGSIEYSVPCVEDARLIYEEMGNQFGVIRSLIQLGRAYNNFEQFDVAIPVLEEAISLAQDLDAKNTQADAMERLAHSYSGLGRYRDAIRTLEMAISIWQELGNPQRELRAHRSLGSIQFEQENYEQAVQSFQYAIHIAKSLDNLLERMFTLLNLGQTYAQTNFDLALNAYSQGLSLIDALDGSPPLEVLYFKSLGDLFYEQDEPELAILFYKQVLQIIEDVRQDIQSIPLELQASYTESVADTYRTLADLLLQQDRVLEAQQVLDLLKVHELDDYLRDVRGNEQTAEGVDYLPPEQDLLALYDQAIPQGVELGPTTGDSPRRPHPRTARTVGGSGGDSTGTQPQLR